MQVKITKVLNVRLATPVTLRVSPLTVAAALSRSLKVPTEAQVINSNSPIHASEIRILRALYN